MAKHQARFARVSSIFVTLPTILACQQVDKIGKGARLLSAMRRVGIAGQ
jgi:hypothetical protein